MGCRHFCVSGNNFPALSGTQITNLASILAISDTETLTKQFFLEKFPKNVGGLGRTLL